MAERISVDTLFESQGAVLGCVEPVPGSSDQVRVTPLTPGMGCACGQSVVIAKEEIEAVSVTDKVRNCCGKRLSVVEISFANSTVASLFQQFNVLAGRRATPRPAGLRRSLRIPRGAPIRPAEAQLDHGNCQQALTECTNECVYSGYPDYVVVECQKGCQTDYNMCIERELNLWPPYSDPI